MIMIAVSKCNPMKRNVCLLVFPVSVRSFRRSAEETILRSGDVAQKSLEQDLSRSNFESIHFKRSAPSGVTKVHQ